MHIQLFVTFLLGDLLFSCNSSDTIFRGMSAENSKNTQKDTETIEIETEKNAVEQNAVEQSEEFETSEEKTVTLEPIQANDDNAETIINKTIKIDVLENDENITSETIIEAVTQTANGSIVINSDQKSLNYTPNKDFINVDAFSYTISDRGRNSTANVAVKISPSCDSSCAIFNDDTQSFEINRGNGEFIYKDTVGTHGPGGKWTGTIGFCDNTCHYIFHCARSNWYNSCPGDGWSCEPVCPSIFYPDGADVTNDTGMRCLETTTYTRIRTWKCN